MIPIIQWLDPLLALSLAHFSWIGRLEEPRCQLDKPLGVNDSDLPHVLLSGHHKLMVYEPVRLPLEKRTAGVDVHCLVLNNRSVTFLRVLPSCVEEETGSDCLSNFGKILAS